MSPASEAAAALLAQLVRRGVSDVVLSPGSRSQALALVAAELEARGIVRLHVRIDERVAGFTALGIGREGLVRGELRPAAVICTSGTAVANLLPAVLEAHHAGVPLLLLTADRPPELRGVGANQTTRQPGIFGSAVRWAIDAPVPETPDEGDGEAGIEHTFRSLADEAWDAATGSTAWGSGPVHLNLPVREPLAGMLSMQALDDLAALAGLDGFDLAIPGEALDVPGDAADVDDAAAELDALGELSGALYQGGGGIGEADGPPELDPDAHVLVRGPRTIVVAGADAGAEAERLSWLGGWPLVAEIVSGAHFGRYLVHGYRAILAAPDLGGRVERVVVFGRPTLSREVAALLSRVDVDVVAVNGPGERVNLNGCTTCVDRVTVASGAADREWLGAWLTASRAPDLDPAAPDRDGLSSTDPAEKRAALDAEVAVARRGLDREGLVDAVWRATWPHDRLVFGSSRLVRVADAVLAGKNVPVHANRGVAGIDGTIATATGIAIASQAGGRPGVTRVVLGDLALLHDVGALLLPPAEIEPRMQVICGNDGGGSIFDGLEVASIADADAMTRVQFTPQTVRIAELARAYGWEYHRPTSRAALDQLLTAPAGGRQLIDVPFER